MAEYEAVFSSVENMAEDVQNIQVAGGVRMQGVDPSQLQQLQFNSVQQQQTMMHVGGAGMDGSQLQMNQTEVRGVK